VLISLIWAFTNSVSGAQLNPLFMPIGMGTVGVGGLVYNYIRQRRTTSIAQDFWDERTMSYLNAYYCETDDIVFDGVRFASPENFLEWAFSPE
jgi:hypothetical protein